MCLFFAMLRITNFSHANYCALQYLVSIGSVANALIIVTVWFASVRLYNTSLGPAYLSGDETTPFFQVWSWRLHQVCIVRLDRRHQNTLSKVDTASLVPRVANKAFRLGTRSLVNKTSQLSLPFPLHLRSCAPAPASLLRPSSAHPRSSPALFHAALSLCYFICSSPG